MIGSGRRIIEVDGYSIESRIHESESSFVFAGVRTCDQRAVILKLYRGDAAVCSQRAERELELLRRIDHPGVVRPVELQPFEGRQVLILERFSGGPLSRHARGRTLALREVLQIAHDIAQSLAAVHDARVIHKDVKPANILVAPDSLRVCLTDFGVSAEFGRAQGAVRSHVQEGTLHYMAPEQTGRVGWGIDFRTDLYSLGATLYELVVGRPPFAPRVGVELVHAHVALRAPSAIDVDPRVALGLSRMLDKLLQKDPELRYQTARGLAADLEVWLKQLHETGAIDDDLVLGQRDASDRLRFPNRLYGRERERRVLISAFERSARGSTEVVLLDGPPGIGKSSLAGSLREHLAKADGYLAEVKFDPDERERPYSGFGRVCDSFVTQILSESQERLDTWAERIRSEVGDIGRVLVDLTPDLAHVVGDFPALLQLDALEARDRLAAAVARLVRAIARPEHPLVLSFDDLQWADPGSLFLIGSLVRAAEPVALLILGGYRDTELPAEDSVGHPLAQLLDSLTAAPVPVHRLHLEPLRTDDIAELLIDTLECSSERAQWLARRVELKSQNNPLLVRRLLLHLWDRDLIHYEHERGWVWDTERLAAAEITDDAVDVVAARIDALDERSCELLELASVIGSVFDLETLVAMAGTERLEALQCMIKLADQGLISPCREGFKFAHDRIREIARARIPDHAEQALHYRAATRMLERSTPAERAARVFEIADHLHRAAACIESEMRRAALDVARNAGYVAARRGAAQSAAHYLRFARELLRDSDWGEDPIGAADLLLQSSRCAYQLSEFEQGLALLDEIDRVEIPGDRRVRVDVHRIRLYTASRSTEETLELSLRMLRRYGVPWSRRPPRLRILWEIWRTDRILRGPPESWAFEPARKISMTWLGPLLLKSAAGQAHSLTSVRLVCRTASDTLRVYLEHGFVRSPGFSIAAFGVYRAAVLRDLSGLERYVDAGLAWSRRVPDPAFGPKAEYLVQAFAYVWIRARRSVAAPLERIARALQEVGDVEYATNALYFGSMPFALSGAPLGEAIAAFERLPVWLGMDAPAQAASLAEPFCRLADPDEPVTDEALARVERQLKDFAGSSACPFLVANWMLALCVMGRFADAYRISESVRAEIFEVHSTSSHVADYVFFRGLAAAVLARSAASRQRRRCLRELRVSLSQLDVWARHGRDFAHMAEMLRAESFALRGHAAQAVRAYQSAAQAAAVVGYGHHAALGHERRAELLAHAHRELEADSARGLARTLYGEWGARAKVRALEGAP